MVVPTPPSSLNRNLALMMVLLAFVLLLGSLGMQLEAGFLPGAAGEILQWLGYLGLFLGILAFLVAHGLGSGLAWAPRAAAALSALSLIFFPQGTILGIILLWYLYRPEVRALFH